jgi:hypothetical protein
MIIFLSNVKYTLHFDKFFLLFIVMTQYTLLSIAWEALKRTHTWLSAKTGLGQPYVNAMEKAPPELGGAFLICTLGGVIRP